MFAKAPLTTFDFVGRTPQKKKYAYDQLSEVGMYFEIPKQERYSALKSATDWTKRMNNGWEFKLAKKEGKYLFVRTA